MNTVHNIEDFEKLKKWEKKVFFQFGASWCMPCQRIKPELTKLCNSYTIYYVDIDKLGTVADNLGIKSVPTIVLFENGVCSEKRFTGSNVKLMNEFFSQMSI